MTEQQLYALLAADAGIASITANVYNGWLPEKASLPAVTLEYVSDQPYNTLQGGTGAALNRYTINAWADSYTSAQNLKAAILSAMSAYPRESLLPLHDYEAGLYRFAIDYQIHN